MDTQLMNNSDLHSEQHTQWNAKLKSLRSEINDFQERLGEMVTKRTDKDFLIELAELENNCIIHKEKINKLQDQIKTNDLGFLRQHATNSELKEASADDIMSVINDRVATEISLFGELKNHFEDFEKRYI